jgi:hypothetical protein
MPNITADLVITQKHKRNFLQMGGANPNNPLTYAGQDGQYAAIQGVGLPESGGVDPIWVPDPRRIGQYQLVGRSITPPDLASATLVLKEAHGSVPKQLGVIGCQFNMYEVTGRCKDLSDFLSGWQDYVLVYAGALVTDKDLGDRTAWDSDDPVEDSLGLVLNNIYPIGALGFGEDAATAVDREVVDIVYGTQVQCGDCGIPNDGTKWAYAITKSSGAGSPGLPGELQYRTDGTANWLDTAITGIGATADPSAIDIVGDKVVVVVNSENAYYWAQINQLTGVPGAFTKVTAGFVAGKAPNDLFVVSPRAVYFVGNGGYIYKATDITAGVTVLNAGSATTNDLLRIHGTQDGTTLLATGRGSTTIVSTNSGATWGATVSSISGVALDVGAALVLDSLRYWVGTQNSGRVFYTLNGGTTWVEKTFSGSGSGNTYDIVAATNEVIYFSHSTNTPTARLFASWDGGADFTNASPRVLNLPTFNKANRIAVPGAAAAADVAANNILLGGLSGGGTDGIILEGVASRL